MGRSEAFAHATLLSSEPKANARLSGSPQRIRLVFSEAVVADLSQIEILSATRPRIRLQVFGDPHDVHAIIASPGALPAGAYRVAWRIISADGHPVGGDFVFTVGSGTPVESAAAIPPPRLDQASHEDASGPTVVDAPLIPSLLRGAGLAAMLALTGLLTLGIRPETAGAPPARVRRVTVWLAVGGPVLLAAHLATWLLHAAPPDAVSRSWLQDAMSTTVGRMEGVRVALALLALWALVLARRPAIAQFLAGVCLIVSGAIGHSAAIVPAVAIPAKAIHLLAISIWLGGLVWLCVADVAERDAYMRDCHRISAIALWALVVVTVTGALQAFLFVGGVSPWLWLSPYGSFVAAKILGLLLLAGFGAYHRQRVMPAVDAGAPATLMRRSVRRETILLIAVVFIGGVMAYVPTPKPSATHLTAAGEP